METLGKKIRQLRVVKNLTQEEVAKHLGIVKATVSAWENEKSKPDIDKIKSLADFLEVNYEYFRDNVQVMEFALQDSERKNTCSECAVKDMEIKLLKERITDLKEFIEYLKKSYSP